MATSSRSVEKVCSHLWQVERTETHNLHHSEPHTNTDWCMWSHAGQITSEGGLHDRVFTSLRPDTDTECWQQVTDRKLKCETGTTSMFSSFNFVRVRVSGEEVKGRVNAPVTSQWTEMLLSLS